MSVQLYLGDWREVLPKDTMVDHVITDPPYTAHVQSRMRSANTTSSIICKSVSAGFEHLEDFSHVVPLIQMARRWSIFFCALEQLGDYRNASIEHWIRSGIYRKKRAVPQFSGDRPGNSCEGLAIFHAKGKKRWNGKGTHAFWEAMPENRGGEFPHPTKKPMELCTRLITLFTLEGETVLDPYAGSGAIGAACLALGRNYIAVEKDPEHFETLKRRFRSVEAA